MILIVTANDALAQALLALISTMVDAPNVMVAKNTAAALRLIDTAVICLVILDGNLSIPDLTAFLDARGKAALFPPVLFLMETKVQEAIARREQLVGVLKGSSIFELTTTIEMLLHRPG